MNFDIVSNPFRGTLEVFDLETLTTFSLNTELQKIDNFEPSIPGSTFLDGVLNVSEMKISEIYDPTDNSSLQFSNSSIGVLAANFNLNDNNITLVNDILANRFIVRGGTDIQYLLADGSLLTQSANSGNSNFYLYNSINTSFSPPVGSGNVEYNSPDQALATIVYISHITRDNIDIEIFFQNVSTLNLLYLQDQNDSNNYIKYDITGNATIITNSYISVPVSAIESGGTGSTSFGPSHNILISIFTNSIETDTRISTLETKTQNQTAVVNNTTFSGGLVCSGLNMNSNKITNLLTPTLPNDATNKQYVDSSSNINIIPNISTNYQFGVINGATLISPNNISVIHKTTTCYATTRLYAQPNVLNYFSCILPNISALPDRNFPENYLRAGFIDETIFPNGYVAYLSIFNVAGVPSYNISWGSNNYDPTDFQFAAGDRLQITIDGFFNSISYVITGAFPNSQTRPYIGSIIQLKATVGFLQGSPIQATNNTYTFSNVLFEQSEPISLPTLSLSSVGSGISLVNNGTTPSLTTKSLSVSGTGISSATSTATDLIITSTALPTTGGTMTGNLISQNILPSLNNTYNIGSSTLPYLTSEATTSNQKTLTVWNSARTQNNTITSAATTSHNYQLPITQGTTNSILKNNGAGVLKWVSGPLYILTTPITITNTSSGFPNLFQNVMLPVNGIINENTIVANTLEIGSSFVFNLSGTITTSATNGDRSGIGLFSTTGGIINTNLGNFLGSAVATNSSLTFQGNVCFTIRTLGSSGTLTCNGRLLFRLANNTTVMQQFVVPSVAINTTIDNLFTVRLLCESNGAIGVSSQTLSSLTMERIY
jgi:hypothetical protein